MTSRLARSQDTNEWIFLIWGRPKEIACRNPETGVEDFTANIHAAVANIGVDVLRRAQISVPRREAECRTADTKNTCVSAVFCVGTRCTLLKCLSSHVRSANSFHVRHSVTYS